MDIDTTKIDFERAAMLLNLIEKQATVAPRATHIGSAAHSELMKLNDSIKVAAREAEVERRKVESIPQNQILDAGGNPTEDDLTDPDPELVDEIEPDVQRPAVYPKDSQTATIADRRL